MAKRPQSSSKKPRNQLQQVAAKRTFTLAEVAQLRQWALDTLHKNNPHQLHRDAAIALVLLGTGARRFELCAFRCGDFQVNAGGPIAHFEVGKGNKTADIAITSATYAIVQHWLRLKSQAGESTAVDAPLFCGQDGEHMSRATLNLIWNKVLQAAGLPKIPGIGVHVTRHAAGMMLLRATNSLSQTAKFLRHSSEAITERFYEHVLPSDIRAGLTKAGL